MFIHLRLSILSGSNHFSATFCNLYFNNIYVTNVAVSTVVISYMIKPIIPQPVYIQIYHLISFNKHLSALTVTMKYWSLQIVLHPTTPIFEHFPGRNRTRSAGTPLRWPSPLQKIPGWAMHDRASDIRCRSFFPIERVSIRAQRCSHSIKKNIATKATHLDISQKNRLTPYPQGPPSKSSEASVQEDRVRQRTNKSGILLKDV